MSQPAPDPQVQVKHHYRVSVRVIIEDQRDIKKDFYLDDVSYAKLEKKVTELGAEVSAEIQNYDQFSKPEATDE